MSHERPAVHVMGRQHEMYDMSVNGKEAPTTDPDKLAWLRRIAANAYLGLPDSALAISHPDADAALRAWAAAELEIGRR